MERTYTLEQIRAAFWAEFHKRGEVWFNYLDSDAENEASTESHWEGFVERLEGVEVPK